mgnify:FL=1
MTIEPGVISALLLEGIKWIIRKIKKNPEFDFSAAFYTVALAVLNALAPFALILIGVASADPVLSMTWVEVLQYVVRVLIGAVVSLGTYGLAIKPLKNYMNLRKQLP